MTASVVSNQLRLFGIDLAAVARYLRDGWSEALQSPALRWLTPDAVVRVVHADGSESFRRGASGARIRDPGEARFTALALGDDSVLRRTLVLPRLSKPELEQAVTLDARTASPFPEHECVWGYAVSSLDPERIRVEIALTSRALIDAQVAAHRAHLGDIEPEIWADGDVPIVMPGYGAAARFSDARRSRRTLLLLLVLAALLVAALAVTPALQLRQQAIEASAALVELQRKVRPQAQMRDEIARLDEQARLLDAAMKKRQDVAALLDEITRRLPDDAVLTRFEFSDGIVRISGQADNAAQLLQALGSHGEFRDVRAPAGIARSPSGGKDSFSIEFSVAAGAKP